MELTPVTLHLLWGWYTHWATALENLTSLARSRHPKKMAITTKCAIHSATETCDPTAAIAKQVPACND